MLELKKLPKDAAEGVVRVMTLKGIDEMQYVYVMPRSSIKMHDHKEKQWEVWIWRSAKKAFHRSL